MMPISVNGLLLGARDQKDVVVDPESHQEQEAEQRNLIVQRRTVEDVAEGETACPRAAK
jgi:hypothetical protein